MNLPLFIARRIYRDSPEQGKQMSRPAVLIAQAGIAIGLAVMIVAVAIIVGFKQQIREKVAGFGAHVQISNLEAVQAYDSRPVVMDDTLLTALRSYDEVAHVQRYSTKAGMLKTDEAFQGMMLKGVGEEYDLGFFRRHLVEGEVPAFSDTLTSNQVLLSKPLADKMKLKVGDKVDAYFLEGGVRVRRLQVAGLYRTNFSEYDNLFLLTDRALVNRLNGWQPEQAGGAELMLRDGASVEEFVWKLGADFVGKEDAYGQSYCVRSMEQLNPQLFAWLGVLDVNIWVILVLMLGVAGFTMISGLLIIIIERTSMIGVLKSLGADNTTIRRLFLWFAVFLIGRGMLWGNVLGLAVVLLQQSFGLFRLDPASYYMDTVPMSFTLWLFLLLNVGTLLASVLMLLGPSHLITRINPATSMRYE